MAPPAFSPEEKARITDALLATGYRLFTTQGLRKTSIGELVGPAGIAKSSFYVFFDAKEALYLELMLAQMAEVTRRVIDQALLTGPDARTGLQRFLHATVDELTANPLYGRLLTHPEELAAVTRRLDVARVTAAPENPVTALTEFVRERTATGELAPLDPAVIIGVLQAVLLLPMHAGDLGDPQRYPDILEAMIDIVATGLTSQKD